MNTSLTLSNFIRLKNATFKSNAELLNSGQLILNSERDFSQQIVLGTSPHRCILIEFYQKRFSGQSHQEIIRCSLSACFLRSTLTCVAMAFCKYLTLVGGNSGSSLESPANVECITIGQRTMAI